MQTREYSWYLETINDVRERIDPAVRVRAIEPIRRMRGGSQPQLIRCSDGEYYVVKFQNNPQGLRVLANELLASFLARKLGLPVPDVALVDVPAELIRYSDDMTIQLPKCSVPCRAGLCFGSRFPRDENSARLLADTHEFPSRRLIGRVDNMIDFAGMLVFDKWTANADNRQTIIVRRKLRADRGHFPSFRVLMIDQGFCFGGTRWDFDARLKSGLHFFVPSVYSRIEGMRAFAPWLERLQYGIDRGFLERAARQVPPEWYENDASALANLVAGLDDRRSRVTHLLLSTRDAFPALFPAWVSDSKAAHA